jgi:hypothetical protein
MEAFTIDVPSEVLDDLAWRLRRARWPRRLLLAGGEDAGRLLRSSACSSAGVTDSTGASRSGGSTRCPSTG